MTKAPTIRDVAQRAGVSTATVSHFINNTRPISSECKARVQEAIDSLGFVPNQFGRLLASKKTAHPSLYEYAANHSINSAPDDDQRSIYNLRPEGGSAQRASMISRLSGVDDKSTLKKILRLIRAQGFVIRSELAQRLGIDQTFINRIVEPLLRDGLLVESSEDRASSSCVSARRGAVRLSFGLQNYYLVGVKIDDNQTTVCLSPFTGAGEIEVIRTFPTLTEPIANLEAVAFSIREEFARHQERKLGAVCVTVPGLTNRDRTGLVYAPRLGWRDLDISKVLRQKLCAGKSLAKQTLPIIVEKSATSVAMLKVIRAASRTDRNGSDAIIVNVDSSISVSTIIDNEIYRGSESGQSSSGEFGHMTIVAGGKVCVCGNRGCWERYASTVSVEMLYAGERTHYNANSAPLEFEDIVGRAQSGERRAQSTLKQIGEYLGVGISNLIAGLGISRVVISGRVASGWNFIEDSINSAIEKTIVGRLSNWSISVDNTSGAELKGTIDLSREEYVMSRFCDPINERLLAASAAR